MDDELLEAFVRLAQIYSPTPLTREQVINWGEQYRRECHWPTLDNGFRSYLRIELNVPLAYGNEALKLGRRLSQLELEALNLAKKIEREKATGIKIIIDGLE